MFLFTTTPFPERSPPKIQQAGTPHAAALRAAARETGISFEYLARTAKRESNFRADAQASTSSARGMFQFIEQTWLRMVREEGGRFGLAEEASAIRADVRGALASDPARRRDILALRDDPAVSARMAGAMAARNAEFLKNRLNRAPSGGELYIAHFMGAASAARLIAMAETQPEQAAAPAFARAAAANRSIFFDAGGQAKSASAVYAGLVRGFSDGPAVEAPVAAAPAEQGKPFHALFRTQAAAPVSEAVVSFWRPARTETPHAFKAYRQLRGQA